MPVLDKKLQKYLFCHYTFCVSVLQHIVEQLVKTQVLLANTQKGELKLTGVRMLVNSLCKDQHRDVSLVALTRPNV